MLRCMRAGLGCDEARSSGEKEAGFEAIGRRAGVRGRGKVAVK